MRVVPAVITVNSLADTNTFDPGSFLIPPGTLSDNFLTFREAVEIVARGTTSGYSVLESAQVDFSSPLGTNDVIRFASHLTASGPATIAVVGGQYNLRGDFKIEGPGADKLTFDANFNSRIFLQQFGDLDVGISGLTLKNGQVNVGDGGVIHNSGTLKLTGVTIQGGQAENGQGGGIFNQGTLSLETTTIAGCSAQLGGGIANNGTLTLATTTISGCFALLGGGIENTGVLTVNQSTFESNAARFGGGIHNDGTNNIGTVTVSNSTFASNSAKPETSITLVSGLGGGIDNQRGAMTVINSTFVGNEAVTGGVITVVNPGARGGAINNQDRLSLIHCTITGNSITADGGGAGVFGKSGATTRMFNSILVANTVGSTTTLDDVSGLVSSDSFGNLTSQTSNPAGLFNGKGNYLIGSSLVLTAPATYLTDLFDPQGLRLNGGPTKTVALREGSFAIDKGFTTQSPTGVSLTMLDARGTAFNLASNPKDQRGGVFPRAYRQPDLGATEFIPTTLVVDSLADNLDTHVPAVTLREAVAIANGIAGDNTITFRADVGGTIKLTQGELALTDLEGTTRIVGPGPNSLAIDGNQTSRIFSLAGSPGGSVLGAKAEIAGLTIQNGNAGNDAGGGISANLFSSLTVSNATFKNNRAEANRAGANGGGIFSLGTLIVGGSTFERNVAGRSGGGIFAGGQGGKSVFNSTFLQNVANGAAGVLGADLTSTDQDVNGGGGIAVFSVVARIENCTFTGNHAVGVGGGIAVLNPDTRNIEIVHSTLTGNTVAVVPGGSFNHLARTVSAQFKGGGIFSQKTRISSMTPNSISGGLVRVINTIVAGNVVVGGVGSFPADYGGPNFDGEYQVSNGAVVGNGMVRDHSVIGGAVSQILAGGLADLGGPTKTIALVNNSSNPALGNATTDTRSKFSDGALADQRGFVRSATAPSIGAFEPGSTTILVTTRTDEDNGTISPNVGTGTSLREAIRLANSLSVPSTITFAADMTGVIELTQGALTLSNPQKITIQGPAASRQIDQLTLDGGRRQILSVTTNAVADISGLNFTNARDGAGAIANSGNLTLRGIHASDNTNNNGGGAITNFSNGVLTLENSTITGNGTLSGGGNRLAGGLLNEGTLIVRGSTFDNNSNGANNGGAAGTGGGLANYGNAFIVNSTFTGNAARVSGGAIHNEGTLYLANDTITNNFSPGAALFTTSAFSKSTAVNTIVVGNFNTSDTSQSRTELNVGGAALATGSSHNLTTVGTVASIFELDIANSPFLNDNGGPTRTIALKTSGPALNAGTDLKTLLTNFKIQSGLNFDVETFAAADQRSGTFNRVFNDNIDLGAFEINVPTSIAASVSSSGDVFPNVLWTVNLTVQNTSNVDAKNVVLSIPLPTDVTFVGLTLSSGTAATTVTAPTVGATGTVEVKFNRLPANTTASFELQLRPLQSAAEKTLSITPTLKQSSSGTETTTPVQVTAKPLPTLPAITTISTVGSVTQTSVGRPVTFQLTVPSTNNGGPQRAKLDATTVTAADFMNSGTATATINSVTVTEAEIDGVPTQTVSVQMTPNNAGTLGLAFKNPFDIKDTLGRAVTSPVPSHSPIDVSAEMLVDSISDVDDGNLAAGQFTLREAIRRSQETAGNDTIKFVSNLGAITLTNELLLNDTTGTVSIFGPDGGTQVIQRATTDTNSFRLFQITSGTSAVFRSLTLANGKSTGNGGGILNLGTLDIDRSTLRFNDAAGNGGAIFNGGGTGQTLGLHRSTLSNNTADWGGAIFNDNGRGNSTLTGELNTISGNSARAFGGGIANVGTLNLAQTTLVLNRADSDGINGGEGGGLAAFNIETLTGSIIAGNTRGLVTASVHNDIGGGFVDTASNNVVADGPSGGAIPNGVNGNIVGNDSAVTLPLASILNPTLTSNGGPTQTHALVPLSPARDAGATSTLTTDQRGSAFINIPDIGAFEYQPTNSPIVLTGDTTISVVVGTTVVVNEVLTGNGNLIKSGPGTLILKGNNTYTGQTSVNGGILVVGHNNALGTASGSKGTVVAANASLAVAQGVTVPEALAINGFGPNDTGALRMIPNSNLLNSPSTWSGPITMGGQSSIDVETNGQLTISGVISASVGSINPGLSKIGSGRLVLTGTNTYPGLTIVNAGELAINGTQARSHARLKGGALTGTGSVADIISEDTPGSRLSPGNTGTNNGIGKLSAKGRFELDSNATFDVQINGTSLGTSLDNVDVVGTVTLNNATLSASMLPGFASSVGSKYQIITNDGTDAVVGTFNGLAEGATLTINGQAFTITYKGGTGNDVVLTHINTPADFRDRSITTVVGENGIATLKGTIVEVDPKDTFKLTINWGDGKSQIAIFPAGSNGKLISLNHSYISGRAEPYVVTLTWQDSNKAGGTAQLEVQVLNVAPTAKVSALGSLLANQTGNFSFKATDPADQSSNMTWTIDWGDGVTETLTRPASFTYGHKYSRGGSYLIRATATDRDGQVSRVTTLQVTVTGTGPFGF